MHIPWSTCMYTKTLYAGWSDMDFDSQWGLFGNARPYAIRAAHYP